MKIVKILLSVLFAGMLFSCSDSSYLRVVPRECTALISIDPAKIAGVNNVAVLKALLHATDVGKTGVDVAQRILMFETQNGDLGVCMKMGNADNFSETLNSLAAKQLCSTPETFRGFQFAVLDNMWLLGYSDDAILVMGPVTQIAQSELRQKMVKYLGQNADDGVVKSRIYERLDSLSAPMAMVARTDALPEQFATLLTVGAPKGADASQIYVSAVLSKAHGALAVDGHTFSFNRKVNQALEQSREVYRPIQGAYAQSVGDNTVSVYMNVDGKKFLPILQAHAQLQVLLSGINSAIDMDNIIKSVDGDMALFGNKAENGMQLSMVARLAHADWLADVDYWKKSCPVGSVITDWKQNAYRFTDGKTDFYFGVSSDKQFFSGSNEQQALNSLKHTESVPEFTLKGQKFVMVVNMQGFADNVGKLRAMSFLKPVFGSVEKVIYRLK